MTIEERLENIEQQLADLWRRVEEGESRTIRLQREIRGTRMAAESANQGVEDLAWRMRDSR